MKTIISVLFFFSSLITVSAQSNSGSAKPSISIDAVEPPRQQTGATNYLLSLSGQDFKNNKYAFCTDSNATVAYLTINGFMYRLAGGPNAEHIMAYVGNGYTVTLSTDKKLPEQSNSDDADNWKIDATLVVYGKDGQVMVKKVTGIQINRVKK